MTAVKIEPRVLMIQLWFGSIPDYFKYHLITTENLEGFDFLIITDDPSFSVEAQNYRVINLSKSDFERRFFEKTGVEIKLEHSKKASDFKICLADLFSEYCEGYSHVGFYDIDTLFSKMNRVKAELYEDWDFITLADTTYADRLNGPFVVFRNKEPLRKAYQTDDCLADLANPNKTDCDENSYSRYVIDRFSVKKIWNCRNVDHSSHLRIEYHCEWRDGNLTAMGRDLEQYHFYHKEKTKFIQPNDSVVLAAYNKTLVNDFYWITGFTSNYLDIGIGLLRSIIKYSNRPCLVYTIDFDWAPPADLIASEQLIIRRFDLVKEGMNHGNRNSFMNAKPLYLIDAIDFLPNAKFVYVDSDAAITVCGDSIKDYFSELEGYPLINSHTHDHILIRANDELINSLDILLGQMNVPRTVYPRRKCNMMLFDSRSLWFFNEQLRLFDKYSGLVPNIFALHDEDSANAILSKYRLTKGLPVIDIEETTDVDLSRYNSYSYAISENSESTVFPSNVNQIAIFHQLKNVKDFDGVDQNYGESVLRQEEIVLKYENLCFSWERNAYHVKDRIPSEIDFIIYNANEEIIFTLKNQRFRNYWTFCVWSLPIGPGLYPTRAIDSRTGRILYSDILQITGTEPIAE